MPLRLILAAALAAGLPSAVQAQQARTVSTCGAQSLRVGDATSLFVDSTGILCSTSGAGGGGGGATGSVTPAGTNGTSAQAIQGINGGVPVAVTSAATSGTQEADVTASRTLDATSTSSQQTYTLNGQSTLSFTLSGLTASGATVSFFQSNDWNGTTGTFTAISEVNTGTGVASLTRNTDGQSAIGIEGTKAIRVQVTTAGTGTITLATNISVRSRYQALRAPLPPGANTIGSIANTAFGISGTLPAFTTTPTFNLGALNGAATAAKQPALGTAGTPSADVLSVQGVSGGTPQNVTTTNAFALDATLTARLGTLGQKTSAGSAPVTIASDQSSLPTAATQAGTWNLANITGTVSLPTGAATATNQSSEIAALGAPADTAYAGTGSASIVAALKGNYNALVGPTPTGTNVIGSTTLRATGTNRSASVTTTASTLMAANTSRQGWKLKNDCAVGVVINFDATASNAAGGGNILLPAGGYMSSEPGFVETGAMSAITTSGTCALTAREH